LPEQKLPDEKDKIHHPAGRHNDWGCTNNSGFGRKSPGKALGAKTYVGSERPPKFDGSLRTGCGIKTTPQPVHQQMLTELR
jgi:hypothetical protein